MDIIKGTQYFMDMVDKTETDNRVDGTELDGFSGKTKRVNGFLMTPMDQMFNYWHSSDWQTIVYGSGAERILLIPIPGEKLPISEDKRIEAIRLDKLNNPLNWGDDDSEIYPADHISTKGNVFNMVYTGAIVYSASSNLPLKLDDDKACLNDDYTGAIVYPTKGGIDNQLSVTPKVTIDDLNKLAQGYGEDVLVY